MLELSDLFGTQNSVNKAIAKSLESGGDPGQLDQVCTDSVNHSKSGCERNKQGSRKKPQIHFLLKRIEHRKEGTVKSTRFTRHTVGIGVLGFKVDEQKYNTVNNLIER